MKRRKMACKREKTMAWYFASTFTPFPQPRPQNDRRSPLFEHHREHDTQSHLELGHKVINCSKNQEAQMPVPILGETKQVGHTETSRSFYVQYMLYQPSQVRKSPFAHRVHTVVQGVQEFRNKSVVGLRRIPILQYI